MNDPLLYTLPQWFIFAGIFVIVYGWVESKKAFRIIGLSILILLGLYSIYILLGDSLAAGKFLTPDEIANEELEEDIIEDIPFQAKLVPAYWSFVVAILTAIPGILLDIKANIKYRWFTVITGVIVLLGFFIIIGAVRSL